MQTCRAKQTDGQDVLPTVKKECNSSTKLRVVFDISAKSSNGVSLNDTLILYPNLTDVLICFRSHPVTIAGDISKMYRAMQLTPGYRDLHQVFFLHLFFPEYLVSIYGDQKFDLSHSRLLNEMCDIWSCIVSLPGHSSFATNCT